MFQFFFGISIFAGMPLFDTASVMRLFNAITITFKDLWADLDVVYSIIVVI